ncbi:MAG: hypothetical protein RM021_003900 [Nostoc sp. EkiNYC01]|nr:hypothetical protein [Nostoc sp. EkiNYC01]
MMDYNQELRVTLQDFRRQALTQFIHEFMRILISEGYTFEDLLDAITSWVALNPELEDVVKHLEEAEQKIRIRGSQSSV